MNETDKGKCKDIMKIRDKTNKEKLGMEDIKVELSLSNANIIAKALNCVCSSYFFTSCPSEATSLWFLCQQRIKEEQRRGREC